MLGCDDNQAAHFEHLKGSRNEAAADGVIMYFKWFGKQESIVAIDNDETSKPNILFHLLSSSSTKIIQKLVMDIGSQEYILILMSISSYLLELHQKQIQ